MSKTNAAIKSELQKWSAKSRSYKVSSGISYGKIRSFMSVYEQSASADDIRQLQSEAGKFSKSTVK